MSNLTETEVYRFMYDFDRLIKEYFNSYKCCMRSNIKCSGSIIGAHAISKKYLKNIIEEKRVVSLKHSIYNKPPSIFKRTSINQATRFNGFCHYHDNALFDSFEKKEFEGNSKQIYDITYRTICRQIFMFRCLNKFLMDIKNGRCTVQDYTGYFKSIEFEDFVRNKQINIARV
jgi:hypothetical protein